MKRPPKVEVFSFMYFFLEMFERNNFTQSPRAAPQQRHLKIEDLKI
jgi:hypothetical protein